MRVPNRIKAYVLLSVKHGQPPTSDDFSAPPPHSVGVLMSLKVIYFQHIFLIDFYIKRSIYMQESGINFTKLLCSGKLKKNRNCSKKEQNVAEQ